MKPTGKQLLLFAIALCAMGIPGNAQSISGSSTAMVGSASEYSFFDDTYMTSPGWDIQDAGYSTWVSGSTYYANVTFNSEGTKTVAFYDGSTLKASMEVYVSPCTPPTPSGSFTYASSTTGVTITRSASPPYGYTWYWQTASTGTSTTSSGTTYTGTGGNTYYLRARDNNYGCWGTAQATATLPGQPTLNSGSGVSCEPGPVTVTMQATVGSNANSVRWYSAGSGGSPLATGTSYGPTLSTTTTYYWCSYHSTNGAEGLRYPVTATVQTRPSVAASDQGICSGSATSIALSNPNNVTPAPTYSWTVSQSNVTGATSGSGGTIAQTLTATALEGTATYAVTASSNGCAGSSINVVARVTAIPTITTTGPNPLVHGTPTQLSTNASYSSFQWKNTAGADIAGQTASTLTVPYPGTFKVNVKSSSSSAWCLSSGTATTAALSAQATSVGMVSTTTIFKEGITDAVSLYALQENEVAQVNQYSDGLGRAFQTVATGAAPNKGDLVTPTGFGKDGITDTTFLPYAGSAPSGALHRYAVRNSSNAYTQSEQYLFYQGTSKVASDTRPFAKSVNRAAPDMRVTEQGAPGLDWQPGNSHTVRSTMTLNTSSYPVRLWKQDGTTTGNYTAKSVAVAISTDENGNKVRTYTNAMGQTVLKQVELGETIGGNTVNWLDTYYVYDDFGRLKYQVPPKAVAILDGTPNLETDSDLSELIYKYTYDDRGRLIEKKEPGAVVKYMVYDIYDRLVLTQDGNLRGLNKWAYVKYDQFGRTVYTGLYTNSRSRTSVQKWVDKAYTASSSGYPESNYVEYKLSGVDSLHGYSNVSFPKDSIFRLAVSYYDNYDFNMTGTAPFTYDASHITGLPTTASTSVRGMATGSKVRLLSATGNVTANWIKGAVFYDSYDRVIQTQSNNHLDLNALDKSSVLYNNIRRVEKTKLTHTAQSVTTHITQRSDYDHAGRVLKTWHQINSNTEVLAAQYEYNALGQVVDKKLHNTGGTNFLQSVDYRYNIRGWLQSINNAQLSDDTGATNDEAGDFFGVELAYNTAAGMSNAYLYNGNISAMKWKTLGEAAGTAGQRSYKYDYDKSDKLKAANFQAYGASAWDKEANTLNESMSYDHGGNIVSLTRKKNARGLSGTTVTSSASSIDDLSYTYTSNTNRISKVEDASSTEGFNNGTVNGSSEYTYTNDGSTNKDENKGISSIVYNFLGKPQTVTYTGGKKVEYVYDAAGTKLTMKVWNGATLESATNYSGGFIYDGSTPSMTQFSSPEGRVVKNGSSFEYQYALADHQGNTRVVFTSASVSAAVVTATFEGDSGDGKNLFSSVSSSDVVPFGTANHTQSGSKVYQMNQTNPVGPAKSVKVYPGDSVKVEVWAYYEAGSGYGTNTVALVSAIASAFGGVSGGGGESGSIYNGVNSALGGFVAGGNAGDQAPAAYLNYILFDQQYKVLDAGWVRVPTSAHYAQQKLSFAGYIKEAGYYFTYLSYEDQSNNMVYFDDYQVRHVKSRLIQGNEYYPYGLQTSNCWTRESSPRNLYLHSNKELDLESGTYDYGPRNYDPAIGRWDKIDKLAEKYPGTSPYTFVVNNPVNAIDPSGNLVIYVSGFRKSDYEAYLGYAAYSTRVGIGIPVAPIPPWVHSQRIFDHDVYNYWGGVDDHIDNLVKTVDNEASIYMDGMYAPLSSGSSRFERGLSEGVEFSRDIGSRLAKHETVKVVGHSQGAAHAAGLANGLLSKGIDVELVFYLAPHQPDEFASPKNVYSFQFMARSDQVSGGGGLAWSLGSSYERVEFTDLFIEMLSTTEGFGGHMIETFEGPAGIAQFMMTYGDLWRLLLDEEAQKEEQNDN